MMWPLESISITDVMQCFEKAYTYSAFPAILDIGTVLILRSKLRFNLHSHIIAAAGLTTLWANKVISSRGIDRVPLVYLGSSTRLVNTLGSRQNGRHFPDDNFKCIFVHENVSISIKISLKFVTKGPINNIPALVQTMAWPRPGDKSLSKPMLGNI